MAVDGRIASLNAGSAIGVYDHKRIEALIWCVHLFLHDVVLMKQPPPLRGR